MKTAEVMFNTKRYIYIVFMCHLSIEKAFKGLYQKNSTAFLQKSIIWFIL